MENLTTKTYAEAERLLLDLGFKFETGNPLSGIRFKNKTHYGFVMRISDNQFAVMFFEIETPTLTQEELKVKQVPEEATNPKKSFGAIEYIIGTSEKKKLSSIIAEEMAQKEYPIKENTSQNDKETLRIFHDIFIKGFNASRNEYNKLKADNAQMLEVLKRQLIYQGDESEQRDELLHELANEMASMEENASTELANKLMYQEMKIAVLQAEEGVVNV